MINNITPIALGILRLLSAYIVYLKVKSSPEGSGKVKEIGDEIHLGAMVFMASEYKRLSLFCLVCIVALFLIRLANIYFFFVGAACSGIAGFIGMYATKANVRTAVAANEKGSSEALNIAFFGGSIMGLTIASMDFGNWNIILLFRWECRNGSLN